MRREAAEVTAAARSRLESLRLETLGRELGRPTVLFPPAGRHALARDDLPDDLPGSWRDRIRLSAAHLSLAALLIAAALAITAWAVLKSAPSATPVPVAHLAVRSPSPAPSAPRGSAAPGVVLVIDVAGKVHRPGIVTLPAGSRVIDAVRRAGGPRRGVDLSSLNLARLVVDGEQILVGGAGAAPVSSAGPSTATGPATLVNLNTAAADALEALPGVGPVTAQKIVAWRTAHGAFTAINDLLQIGGIGPKKLAELAPFLTL